MGALDITSAIARYSLTNKNTSTVVERDLAPVSIYNDNEDYIGYVQPNGITQMKDLPLIEVSEDTTPKTVTDAVAIALDYLDTKRWKRPNQELALVTGASISGVANLPVGKSIRLKIITPVGKTLTLWAGTHKDIEGEAITELPLPSTPECDIMVYNRGGSYEWALLGSGLQYFKSTDDTVWTLDVSTYQPGWVVTAHADPAQKGVLVFRDPATLTDPTNIPPTANAGADQTVNSGDVVTLAGTASDSDGTVTTLWTVDSGSAIFSDVTILNPTVTGLTVGANVLRLTATDDGEATFSDTVTITVSELEKLNAATDFTATVDAVTPATKINLTWTNNNA